MILCIAVSGSELNEASERSDPPSRKNFKIKDLFQSHELLNEFKVCYSITSRIFAASCLARASRQPARLVSH